MRHPRWHGRTATLLGSTSDLGSAQACWDVRLVKSLLCLCAKSMLVSEQPVYVHVPVYMYTYTIHICISTFQPNVVFFSLIEYITYNSKHMLHTIVSMRFKSSLYTFTTQHGKHILLIIVSIHNKHTLHKIVSIHSKHILHIIVSIHSKHILHTMISIYYT